MKRRKFISTISSGVGIGLLAGCQQGQSKKNTYSDASKTELLESISIKYRNIYTNLRSILDTKADLLSMLNEQNYSALNQILNSYDNKISESFSLFSTISEQINELKSRSEDSFDTVDTVIRALQRSIESAGEYLSGMRNTVEFYADNNKERFNQSKSNASISYTQFEEEFSTLPSSEDFNTLLSAVFYN